MVLPSFNPTIIPIAFIKNPNPLPWPVSPHMIWLQLMFWTSSCTSPLFAHNTTATPAFFLLPEYVKVIPRLGLLYQLYSLECSSPDTF